MSPHVPHLIQIAADTQEVVRKSTRYPEVPQTVEFIASIHYGHIERERSGQQRVCCYHFKVFEEMLEFYRKERKRRAYKDRATDGYYRLVLTDLGKERIEKGDSFHRRKYQAALDGTLLKI